MNIVLSEEFKRTMKKLKKKDSATFRTIQKKVNQIVLSDERALGHFKNLRGDMSDYKRVHVGSLVLLFKIEKDSIIFDRLVHHDRAY
jgi:YafQ family addiction module toxin component